MLDFSRFTHLSFDCYGTLIDWESGILSTLRYVLERYGIEAEDAQLLSLYAECEAQEEAGPFKPYRDVLRGVMDRLAGKLGFAADEHALSALPASLGHWPPFADTIHALGRLGAQYRLAILSNIDDDLFAGTARQLGVAFDTVVTAQQVGSYKPSEANFHALLAALAVPREQVLHVAQSLYHDHAPAQRLGFTTVHINRPSRLPNLGLTLPADASPDLTLPDLKSLADAAGV